MSDQNPSSFATFRNRVAADLFRYAGATGRTQWLSTWRYEPGFRLTFHQRLGYFLNQQRWAGFGLSQFANWIHHRISVRYGVYLSTAMDIGGGLYIPHPCGIIVNRRCTIGRDCNLSQNVTLGASNRGPRKGNPTIGDRVYLGPGAVVIGNIRVGDDAAIGANCVVTRDVPNHSVAVGVPGRVVSDKGSAGYVNHITSLPSPTASNPAIFS